MADASAEIAHGEKRPVYGQATAASGTLLIAASPAPTYTLYDSAGAVVTGHNAQPVTGYDPSAQAAVRAWVDLNTLSPTDLTGAWYTLVFKFTATGSDAIERVYEPSIEVNVLESPAAYGPIFGWVRRTLDRSETSLPDGDIQAYVDSTVRLLIARFPGLVSYAGLTGNDRLFFQEGVGLLVALRMRPTLGKTVAVGDLQSVKLGAKEFKWAAGRAGVPLEQLWLSEAKLALGQVGAVHAVFAANAAAFQPFRVSGPSRHRAAAGGPESLMSSLISLITDDWSPETDQSGG